MFGKTFAALSLSAVLVLGSALSASAVNTDPESPVLDGADVFTSSQETELHSEFARDYDKYGVVTVVETIVSLNGAGIESYALTRANELGVGDADKDNGVYILISRDDREVRFELGSSVSDVVSDATVQDAVDNVVLPSFRNGDYFTGVAEGAAYVGESFTGTSPTEAPSSSENTSAGIDWASFLFWAGVIVGGLVGIFVLLFIISQVRYTIDRNRRIRARELKERRQRFIWALIGDFMSNHKAEQMLLDAADENARREILAPLTARYLESDPEFASETYQVFMEGYLSEKMKFIQRKHGVNMDKYVVPNSQLQSPIADMLERFEDAAKRRRIQEDKETARREAELKARRKAEAKAAAERQKLEKLQKDASKKLWDSLTEVQKAKIRAARTKKDKIKVLDSYNTSPLDTNIMFPILFGMYASEVGRPQSDSYGSSSSHRSSSSYSDSSSSSYSSPSYDSSSFSGGSFDGGGGGGSW